MRYANFWHSINNLNGEGWFICVAELDRNESDKLTSHGRVPKFLVFHCH